MPEFYSIVFTHGDRTDFTHPAEVPASGRDGIYEASRREFGSRVIDVVYRQDLKEVLPAVQKRISQVQAQA